MADFTDADYQDFTYELNDGELVNDVLCAWRINGIKDVGIAEHPGAIGRPVHRIKVVGHSIQLEIIACTNICIATCAGGCSVLWREHYEIDPRCIAP